MLTVNFTRMSESGTAVFNSQHHKTCLNLNDFLRFTVTFQKGYVEWRKEIRNFTVAGSSHQNFRVMFFTLCCSKNRECATPSSYVFLQGECLSKHLLRKSSLPTTCEELNHWPLLADG